MTLVGQPYLKVNTKMYRAVEEVLLPRPTVQGHANPPVISTVKTEGTEEYSHVL